MLRMPPKRTPTPTTSATPTVDVETQHSTPKSEGVGPGRPASILGAGKVPKLKLDPASTKQSATPIPMLFEVPSAPPPAPFPSDGLAPSPPGSVPVPSAGLSALATKIDPANPKLQLFADNPNFANPFMQGKSNNALPLPTEEQLISEAALYARERARRTLYLDIDLHVTLIQLILSLLVAPDWLSLEHVYCEPFPHAAKKLNVPYLLHLHINHPENSVLIPLLNERVQSMGPSVVVLLRLLSCALFNTSLYRSRERIAQGAYGVVYRCTLPSEMAGGIGMIQTCTANGTPITVSSGLLGVKLIDVPMSIHDRCVLQDIFHEVIILHSLKAEPTVCHIYDFGVDDQYYYLAMQYYGTSLKQWRVKQKSPMRTMVPWYLYIYRHILEVVALLSSRNILHFDIKCDNFLMHPVEGDLTIEEFWDPPALDMVQHTPFPFELCVADFGESKMSAAGSPDDSDVGTFRNRGTEYIKSPEMLTIANAANKDRAMYDRRRKHGAGAPCDVWSVGCLLYELLTGDFLFFDEDWTRFFIRATNPAHELIPPDRRANVADIPFVCDLLDYILVRDAIRRPTIHDVIHRFDHFYPHLTPVNSGFRTTPVLGTPRPGGVPVPQISPRLNIRSTTPILLPSSSTSASAPSPSPRGTAAAVASRAIAVPIRSTFYAKLVSTSDPPERSLLHKLRDSSGSDGDALPIGCIPLTMDVLLGSHVAVSSRRKLREVDVTHLLDCSRNGGGDPHPHHFSYQRVDADALISMERFNANMEGVIQFVREGAVRHGRVLMYGDMAVTVAMAYFMDTMAMTLYEAWLFVRERWPAAAVDPQAGGLLRAWSEEKQAIRMQIMGKPQFRCLCGSCVFVLDVPFDSSENQNPRGCCCQLDQPSDCPNVSCSTLLEEMRTLYDFHADMLIWGYTTQDRVSTPVEPHYVDFDPLANLPPVLKQRAPRKDWVLYRCRTCLFATHAICTRTRSSEPQVALVTNLLLS